LIIIEDYPRFKTPANIIINGNLASSSIEYPEIPNQILIKGSKYCLIDYNIADIPDKKMRKNPREIFIYIGQHDKTNILPSILNTLLKDENICNFNFNVIVDNRYKNLDEINQISLKYPNISVYHTPENILDIMHESDLAISNDFYTIHRLLAVGVPTISVAISESDSVHYGNIEELIENIWRHKYIGLANEETDTSIDKVILKKVNKLISSYSMRETLMNRGKKTLDCHGAQRVADILKTIIKT
jgi:spore coat polysaccharide biosynthesis predicted glycosyltransferase SpsG